ncbi:MAG: SET domain-containing protein, partial [Dolichospermum sp.]
MFVYDNLFRDKNNNTVIINIIRVFFVLFLLVLLAMIHPDTFVSSTQKGMGLFARRDFQRGEVLWIIDDHDVKIPLEDYMALDEQQKQKLNIYSYLDFFHRVIIPWDEGKYVNHDCEPNSTGLIQYDNISIALREIKAGEEIVEDYSCYFGHFETFKCMCGSYNCRQLIS